MSGNLFKFIAGTFLAGSFFSTNIQGSELPSAPHPLIVILLGPPGSGKGTQASMLREKLQIPHISTGDLLREQIRQGTELGKKAKTYIDQGQLVPDQLILDMLFDRVAQKDCANGYILDGFPRTMPQAEAYHARLINKPNIIAINLLLGDQKIIDRLTKRIVCGNCGTPYHLTYSPPKQPGICDKCHAKLIQRSDDTEEVVVKRLKVYQEQTAPLIDFYHRIKLLHNVDCNDSSKEGTFSQILSFLPRN
ncbi:MAG TPA: adenylate kinase [Rhabdochlamydiaceae bacterium]|nr:adenylate kinase [Rhabdochlamydiaceae bacterium]